MLYANENSNENVHNEKMTNPLTKNAIQRMNVENKNKPET